MINMYLFVCSSALLCSCLSLHVHVRQARNCAAISGRALPIQAIIPVEIYIYICGDIRLTNCNDQQIHSGAGEPATDASLVGPRFAGSGAHSAGGHQCSAEWAG